MSYMDVMYGPLGSVNQGFQNNLAQNAAAMQASNAALAQQQALGAQNQAALNNAYGPMGFGGQTAMYAGLGAAYGRATGGFAGAPGRVGTVSNPGTSNPGYLTGGGGGGGYPSGQVERGPDLQAPPWQNPITSSPWEGAGFDPVKYLNLNPDIKAAGADPWQHAQQFGFNEGRSGIGWNPYTYLTQNPDVKAAGVNPWEHAQNFGFKEGRSGLEGLTQTDAGRSALARAMTAAQPKNPYAGMILGPGGNPSYFNPGTYAGDQGNYGIPYNGAKQPGDIGFSAQPKTPNLGYNPGMANWFANPSMNANQFQNRFGMGFPGAGTPSQVMPGYGNSLTLEDQFLAPHLGFGGSATTGGGGA